jgi:hypothetical protein
LRLSKMLRVLLFWATEIVDILFSSIGWGWFDCQSMTLVY